MFTGINVILDSIRLDFRNTILKKLGLSYEPHKRLAEMKRTHKDDSIWHIWSKMFEQERPYTRSDDDGSNNNMETWTTDFALVQRVSMKYLPSNVFSDNVNAINDILVRNINNEDDCSTTVRALKKQMDEYANATFSFYDSLIQSHDTDFDLEAYCRDNHNGHTSDFWLNDTWPTFMFIHYDTYEQGGDDYDTNTGRLARAVYPLSQSLLSPSLDNSARRFLLNQGPGSCGMTYDDYTNFVYFLPFLTSTLHKPLIIDKILRVYPDALNDDGDDGDVEDSYQVALERRFRYAFERRGVFFTSNASDFRDVPHADDPAEQAELPQREAPTADDINRQSRHRTRGGTSTGTHTRQPSAGPNPPPNPTTQTPPQPTIPDDSTYSPNPTMVWKERAFIKAIQSLPNMDMTRDHMTRFRSTSEQATAISLSQITSNDKTMFAGKNKYSQRYLITFTRRGRKPIFNPVN